MIGPRWRGSLSQALRGALGLGFPWLLMAIPADKRITGPVIMGAVLLFIAARIGSLFEPETLRRGGGMGAHIGEAIFVSLALTMGLVLLAEADFVEIGIGLGVILVIGYLLLHAIALPIVGALRAEKTKDRPARPILRRFVYTGAFVAQEGAALLCIALAVHVHVEARQGPWGLWEIVPILPMIVLAFFYLPLLWLESAAHPGLSRREADRAAFEGALLQVGAVLVGAFTGTNPWV